MGRALEPLSPPTITHEIPLKLMCPKSSRRGSIDKNRTAAGAERRCWTRGSPYFLSSTLTPHHICCCLEYFFSDVSSSFFIRSERLVSTCTTCQFVFYNASATTEI